MATNSAQPTSLTYTLVIPLYNEEENLRPLIDEIEQVMSQQTEAWEVLCVEDGSKDSTREILSELVDQKPFVRALFFEKNFGQSAAFAAGFQHARGNFVITMDGDRQNDPKDIPLLISSLKDYDMIVGWRVDRKDTWLKKVISRLSNTLRKRICRDGVHDTGCSLKLMRRTSLTHLPTFRGMHRFLPALFVMEGKKVTEVPVNHREREKGVTKYHFFNRLSPILDLIMMWWLKKRWISLSSISLQTKENSSS